MVAVPTPPPAPALSAASQALVTTFNASLTADQRTNFANALQNSPALITQINTAVAAGELRGFSLLLPGTNAGGQFSPTTGTMQLPAASMTTPAGGTYNPAELTFVLGHETQHAINRPTSAAALTTFAADVNTIGRSATATHDYTAPLNTMLAVNRNDEATAHIGGFNATVGMVRSTNATPSLEDIYRASPGRMGDFITVTPGTPATPGSPATATTPAVAAAAATPTSYALRAGLTLNADMSMTPNAANTAAMGQHYYDQPAASARLGHNGDSNYQNYYATNLVGYVAQVERANAPTHAAAGRTPQLTLNMTTLGISEAQMERNGLNLGAAAGRQPYFDSSTTPPTAGNLDHTIATHAHVPITMPNALPTVAAPVEQQTHPAIRQAMDAIKASPNIPANALGLDPLPAAAGLALHAANQNITVNHAVLNDRGTGLHAVQGPLGDPAARVTTALAVADAVKTDVAAAQQKLEVLQPVLPQVDVAARNLSAQQDNPTQEAPRPSR
jgi:hypothetical protein